MSIVIETPRLILRPPNLEDLQDWVLFAADEKTMLHLGGVQSPSMAWRSLMTMIGSWAAQHYAMFSVIEKSSGHWIGRIGPWQPLQWPGQEVGWGLHADYWHRGYAVEAAAASIDWAFEYLNWPEVIHTIAAENMASIALAEKLGSRYQRQAMLPAPMDLEVGVWQQTREQWQVNRKTLRDQNMIKIYGMKSSGNCYKVQLLLEMMGNPYHWVETNSAKGETRTKEYLAKNPNGKVPLLELENGECLAESNAILCYLAEASQFLPIDSWQKAQVMQWLFFEQYSHEPYIAVARFIKKYLPADHERHADLPRMHQRGYQALDVMEQQLGKRRFIAGDFFSIADIALFAYTYDAGTGGFDVSKYANVQAWLARVKAQPGFIAQEN